MAEAVGVMRRGAAQGLAARHPLKDFQNAAGHADPRYDRTRKNRE